MAVSFLSTDHPYHRHEAVKLEGVTLASFRRRLNAFALDWLLIFAPYFATIATYSFRREAGGDVPQKLYIVLLVIFIAYFTLLTFFWRGQTLGKRWQRIRVVPLFREHLTLWQCFERALGYSASSLEAGFGFFQYFTHPNRQTVHDRIAETLVINES